MTGSIDLEKVLDALAERVALKLGDRLTEEVHAGPRLMSVEEAAVYLGRTKMSMQHMVAVGALPVVRSDRRVFLDREDLDRWIESNKRAAL